MYKFSLVIRYICITLHVTSTSNLQLPVQFTTCSTSTATQRYHVHTMYYHSLTTSLNTVRVLFSTFHTIKKTGSRTEPILTFGSNVTTQNLHAIQLFANTKRVNFKFIFLILSFELVCSRTGLAIKTDENDIFMYIHTAYMHMNTT